ncbi:hypothetical protein [Streptosporangium roseum]|uniref:hypothetical protein n=1 Tax=Streptosporangium roseum TaxID=2001 RepID=UPI0033221E60
MINLWQAGFRWQPEKLPSEAGRRLAGCLRDGGLPDPVVAWELEACDRPATYHESLQETHARLAPPEGVSGRLAELWTPAPKTGYPDPRRGYGGRGARRGVDGPAQAVPLPGPGEKARAGLGELLRVHRDAVGRARTARRARGVAVARRAPSLRTAHAHAVRWQADPGEWVLMHREAAFRAESPLRPAADWGRDGDALSLR